MAKKNSSRTAVTCVHCGIKSAYHSTCEPFSKNEKKAACNHCIELNKVCFYRHDRKQTKTSLIGHIYHVDPILDIEMGANKGRSAHISSWNNNRGKKRAQFEKVLDLWEVRGCLPSDIPHSTSYPNSIPLSDNNNLDDCHIDEKFDSDAERNDRFKLPSHDLLSAIYTLAHEKLKEEPTIFGNFQPSVLVALGILLQEIVIANQDQEYDVIPHHIITAIAPNIYDVLGTKITNQDYRAELLETLKPKRKRKRPEHLFLG